MILDMSTDYIKGWRICQLGGSKVIFHEKAGKKITRAMDRWIDVGWHLRLCLWHDSGGLHEKAGNNITCAMDKVV